MYLEVDVVIIEHALLNLSGNKDDQLVPEHQGRIKVITTTISYCHYELLPLYVSSWVTMDDEIKSAYSFQCENNPFLLEAEKDEKYNIEVRFHFFTFKFFTPLTPLQGLTMVILLNFLNLASITPISIGKHWKHP